MNTYNRDRIIVLTSISVVLLAFIFFWARSRSAPDPEPEIRPIPVSTIRPAQSDLQENLVFSAHLQAGRSVTVIPKVSGTILEILVEEGSEISQGDLLARIDPEPYLLELQAAESAWLLTESSLSRIKRMHESSGASRQQLDEAHASRDAAYSTYKLANMKFEYSDIRAPISGRVLYRFSDSGNTASPEQALFLLGDDGDPEVRIQIPEKYWSRFSDPGSIKAVLSFPGGGGQTAYETGVTRVSPSISPEGKTFEVTCRIPSDENSWPIGAQLSVDLILSESMNAWSLPLRSMSGGGSLWRVEPENHTVTRMDAPQIFRDKERFVVPGEWAGELFVLDGHHRLHEGQAVTPFDGGA